MVNQWTQVKGKINIYQIYPDIALNVQLTDQTVISAINVMIYTRIVLWDIQKNSAVKLSCSRKIEVKWNQYNSYKVTNPKTKWSIIDSVVQPISCNAEVLYSLTT